MADKGEVFQAKPTFNKPAKTRPSYGLPTVLSESTVEKLNSELQNISAFPVKPRPSELSIDKILKSNQIFEDALTSINHMISSTPTENPGSVNGLQQFALPSSTSKSPSEFEFSKKGYLEEVPFAEFEENEEFDAVCVNCFACVSSNQIDMHSRKCFRSQVMARKTEYKLRLDRIRCMVVLRMINSTGSSVSLYEELLKVIDDLQGPFNESLEERIEVLCNHASCCSLAGLLLAMRIKNLAKEFSADALSHLLTIEDVKAYKDREKKVQNEKLCLWHRKSVQISTVIEDVRDITSSPENEPNHSLLSGFTDMTSPCFDENLSSDRLGHKKSFFARCLKVKSKLPRDHPAHKVLISNLYSTSLKEAVPVECWESYIKANLGVVE